MYHVHNKPYAPPYKKGPHAILFVNSLYDFQIFFFLLTMFIKDLLMCFERIEWHDDNGRNHSHTEGGWY
jgi:hypothetical protein